MAFLCLGTLASTLAWHLGTILKSKITDQEHKNVKNVPLNRPYKGHLFTVGDLEQEGRV